jgi:DNA-binding CsgD family transcriptional regulator
MSAQPGDAASRRLFDLSELILELQRSAASQPAEAFIDWIFGTVGRHVSFDSALWAMGQATLPGAPAMHTLHSYRQPPPLTAEYAKIVSQHPLLADSLRSLGVSVVANVRDGRFDPVVEYLEKHGIAHAVNTCDVDSITGLFNHIALWRADGARPFTEDERLFVQAAFRHLVDACTRNRMSQVFRREGDAGGGRWTAAAADRAGMLHYAEDGFARMLREEWPTWKGAQLPPSVSEAIASGKAARIVGAALVCRIRPVQDLFLIEVRRCGPIDSLTPREREVAAYTSQGLSHKEIAALLGLAPATVRNHLAAASRRLQARNKAQLAALVQTYD